MKTKLYTSLLLWLAFIILVASYSLDNQKDELQAITTTKNSILEAQKKYYDKEINEAEVYLEENGNDRRDIKVQDTVKLGRAIIDSIFENDEIKAEIIMPFLSKYYHDHKGVQSDEEEIMRSLVKRYKGNNKLLKSVDDFSCYQYAYGRLFDHYYKLWNSGCGFDKISIVKSSDTTVAFHITGLPNYIEIPKKTIQLINQENSKEDNWVIKFDKKSTKPIIFQINTYTKTDTTRKRYQIKPQKGKKLGAFDYEEIEIK
ncbi:hypothetical protein Fleli_2745 [Bernardetia litoralis DSM 6794]|uniref:Uncharacterized protein n=1 Tax=Bernardetia litoralis (strain ATCC 23117 / DSM 6794 / NBRC 15988 / NCIMB 1366 / Fx l1 / Sio-4) TaxID=880071 RepID=I4AMB4_BERLS|nr:hypothetical protein [Bernardetia litoralis]AFM05099.1 hypothetical protein Fleli_2745 [Bernardetia litoralis DSM 6794]